MRELENIIAGRIGREGPISFAEFMEMALYYPGLGYYTRPETEIGSKGDFYTSPHLHPAFGALMGRQVRECWDLMGRPAEFRVMEPGGGRGWLARDLLDHLKGADVYDAMQYLLVELNPSMRERQAGLLEAHGGKVAWADGLDALEPSAGVILSNELIDAMPVHVVEVTEQGLREVCVAMEGGKFAEVLMEPGAPGIGQYMERYAPGLPVGYRTEVNLALGQWLGSASRALAEGYILTVDYGHPAMEYFNADRPRGTLLCYHGHRADEDFYEHVGGRDLTAHVNFSAMKDWGEELGMTTLGYCRQGVYLVSMGLDEVVVAMYGETPGMGRELQKIQGLIMPGTMGDTHKVLLQHKGGKPPAPEALRGFGMKNEVGKL